MSEAFGERPPPPPAPPMAWPCLEVEAAADKDDVEEEPPDE